MQPKKAFALLRSAFVLPPTASRTPVMIRLHFIPVMTHGSFSICTDRAGMSCLDSIYVRIDDA